MKKLNLSQFAKDFRNVVIKHSPGIMTGLGIAGMLTAGVLAVKATPKAMRLIEEEKEYRKAEQITPTEVSKLDVVKITWKCYIPSVLTAGLSTACLICANSVNTRRNAALAAAYTLSESALKEYQEKVVETIGEKKEQVVREKIAEDRIAKNPVDDAQVILTEKGNTLFYESISGRYFKSDIDKVRHIVNDLNEDMLTDLFGYISLNDFFDELGLEQTSQGDMLGWSVNKGIIKIDIHAKVAKNGEPCIVLDYLNPPVYKYDSLS